MRKLIFIFIFFFLIVDISFGVIGGGNFCIRGQDCEYNFLVVENLSVTGAYLNVTVINFNVTDSVNADSFVGNGSQLTDLTHSLDDAYDDGNIIELSTAKGYFILNVPGAIQTTGVKIQNQGTDVFRIHASSIPIGEMKLQSESWGTLTTDTYSLGSGTLKWKHLYLSGNLDDGTNSLTVANAKTAYDFSEGGHNDSDINVGKANTSELCVNSSCIDDWDKVNVSVDLSSYLQNDSDATINTLTVTNITSPYANKSSIAFFSDGSVGITLDPIESPESPPIKEKEITRTPSTETVCQGGVCNLVLYSGIRFVKEDNKWKELWEARSLKNSGIKCIVESDGTHIAICDDFNYTHRKIKTSINQLSAIDKTNIPITVYYEEYNLETEELEIIEKSKEVYNFELTPNRDEWIEASYGDIVKVGDKSTTIKLQGEGDCLDDDGPFAEGNSPEFFVKLNEDTAMRWNISSIPSGSLIDLATLSVFSDFTGGSDSTLNIYEFSNRTWNEEDGISTSTLKGNQLDTVFVGQQNNIWINVTVTSWVSSEYNDSHNNLSFYMDNDAGTAIHLFSKEYTTDTTFRPYLNITYSPAPAIRVTSTLVSPSDDSTDSDGVVTFNCSAIAESSSLVNISLYHNITGTWKINETKTVIGTSAWVNFTYDIANNTNLIWNCLACNDATNCSFATNNWTLTVSFPPPKNPKLSVFNMSEEVWYVDSRGDMWLANKFKMDVIPKTTETYSIGSSTLRWLKGWFYDLDVSNDLLVAGNSYADSFIGNIIGFHEENVTVTVSGGIGSNSSINCCNDNTILQIVAFPTSAANSYFFNVTSVNTVEVIQSNNSLKHTGNWLAPYRTTGEAVINYNISGATIDEDFTIRTRWKR